jgi:hypothetical protein
MKKFAHWLLARTSSKTKTRPPHRNNRARLNLEAFEERAMPGSMLTSADWLAPLSLTGNSGSSIPPEVTFIRFFGLRGDNGCALPCRYS